MLIIRWNCEEITVYIVTIMGMAYSLNTKNYKKLLADIASDVQIDMDNYGKYLSDIVNVTDMSRKEAQELLLDLLKSES